MVFFSFLVHTILSAIPTPAVTSLLVGVDNVNKLGLQASAANQEAVNILLLGEVLAVLAIDTATVQDAGLLRNLLADVGAQPLADGLVDLLGLLDGGDLAGADGPDGLVGNNNALPVGRGELRGEGGELALNDGNGLAGLALGERLATAPDDAHAAVNGELGLGSHHLIRLAQQRTPLRVAQDGPVHAQVLELRHADLAGEGAVGLVIDVLRSHLDAGLGELFARELEIERRRGDDNLCPEANVLETVFSRSILPEDDVPTLGSSWASLRFLTIPLMDSLVPFLWSDQHPAVAPTRGFVRIRAGFMAG
jgi:hypothetical protein